MNNPYAYPGASTPMQPAGPGPRAGEPQYWTPTEVLGPAWEGFKRHAGLLIAGFFLMGLVMAPILYAPVILMLTQAVSPNSVEFHGVNLGAQFANLIVSSYFTVGFARICATIAKGEQPSFGMLFAGRGYFAFLGFQFLLSLPGYVGHGINIASAALEMPALAMVSMLWNLLILVPLVFAWLVWSQVLYLVSDKKMGLFEAMRTSAAITRGQRAQIFLAGLLGGLILLGGIMACGVGSIVAGPVFLLMLGVIYARLSGQDPAGMPIGMTQGSGYATYPSGPAGYGHPGHGYGNPPPPAGGYGGG